MKRFSVCGSEVSRCANRCSVSIRASVFFVTGLLLTVQAASATPRLNAVGDYVDAPPRQAGAGYQKWRVVDADPKGLNCRMASEFRPVALDGANAPTALYENNRHNISQWSVVFSFAKGQELRAVTGNWGAQQIMLRDRDGNSWLGVHTNAQRGDCFVRANRRFVEPIVSGAASLKPGNYFAQGSMFARSRRAVAARSGRTCLMSVDGPPTPYQGNLAITVSSLSVRDGKLYRDSTNEALDVGQGGTSFNESSRGGQWQLQGETSWKNAPTQESQAIEECLASRQPYVRKMQGQFIPGQPFPKSR
ncbi:MAG: hypothetical protein KME13_02645 [Myxacorys californica WJT36-NPBG1]|nr:hypothetical protein [Myxacorys californica WJT36-NPBG1]